MSTSPSTIWWDGLLRPW